ncbi:MAG: FAD-dependent oxidoreductase [Acidimicrobiales bacterium]
MQDQLSNTPGVVVVGCGVAGLTTAITLRQTGHDAHIVARDLPHDCVSVVAGAIWGPTSVKPVERTGPWALKSRHRFGELINVPETGVARMVHVELLRDLGDITGPKADWATHLGPDQVPDGYAGGLQIDGFIIEPPIYLQWLLNEFERLGGTVTLAEVADLEDIRAESIVNCTGLGARELVGDNTMFGIRGQMVLVPNDGIDTGISDETDPQRISYIYPRSNHLYLGGARDTGDHRPDPDPALTERILNDAPNLDPRVAGREPVDVRVGFRPGRPSVRLERETLEDGRTVVHNYGHGGAGYIMSWGCAGEVAELLGSSSQQTLTPSPLPQ